MASLNPISGVLGIQKAAHLLRRATFGPHIQDISTFSLLSAQEAFQVLIVPQAAPVLPKDPANGLDWVFPNVKNPNTYDSALGNYTTYWWMENMRSSGTNLTDRMLWFYHTHFPMIMSRIEGRPQFPIDHLRLLRFYALGNYKTLTKALCKDNAMLVHLDGSLNIKGVPQENFAREFLELFAVGKGAEQGAGDYTNFSEVDVKAATKVFTGWDMDFTYQTIDPETNLPTGKVKSNNGTESSQHDISPKQFSAAFNNTIIQTNQIIGANASIQAVHDEIDDLIDMVFASPHTALHICRRIYRQFVYYNITPEIETDIIVPLADILRTNDYEISAVLEILLQSEHFYDVDTPSLTEDNNIGAIIKSPVDLVIGTLRLFDLQVPNKTTNLTGHYNLYAQLKELLILQGLELFEPFDVAGYDPYFQSPDFQRYWISSNYLANRYKFSDYLVTGFVDENNNILLKLDCVLFVKNNISNPADATILVQELVRFLFPIDIDNTRFLYFKDSILLDQLSAANWSMEWSAYVNSNNDVNVRSQVEGLILAMMQAPEYQIY